MLKCIYLPNNIPIDLRLKCFSCTTYLDLTSSYLKNVFSNISYIILGNCSIKFFELGSS